MIQKLILRDYQEKAVQIITKWFKKNNYFILGDEGGLGKTAISLKIIERLYSIDSLLDNTIKKDIVTKKNIVIICPAFLKDNWLDEIKLWLPKTNKHYNIILETYSSVIDIYIARYLYSLNIDLLILDEAHYLKSFNSIRTQYIYGVIGEGRKIIKKAKKVLALSATIVPNNIGEIYPFFWAVKSNMIHDLTQDDFIIKHSTSHEYNQFGLTHKGIKDANNFLKDKPYFLRRTIDDVAKDIPKGQRLHINLSIDKKLLNEEKELIQELLLQSNLTENYTQNILDNYDLFEALLSTTPAFVRYSEFKKRQGLIKVKPVFEYIQNIVLPEHKKFIIVCYHKDVAKKYYELICKITNVNITLLTSEIEKSERFRLVKKADKEKKHIIISTIGVIKEGLNCTGFSYTFFAEIDWRWYYMQQTEYRTRRIGSLKPMFWYYFLFEKGIDQKIFSVLNNKKETLDLIYNKDEK